MKIASALVVAVDFVEEKLELARKLGADYTINSRREEPGKVIQGLGGAVVAIGAMSFLPEHLSKHFIRYNAAGR